MSRYEVEKILLYLNEETAEELMEAVYRTISRKLCIVSRVDRSDWKEFMVAQGYSRKAPFLADQYRRVYSNDRLTVSNDVLKKMKNSSNDQTGYVNQ